MTPPRSSAQERAEPFCPSPAGTADISPISGFINAIGTGGTVHFRSDHSPRDGLIKFL